MSFTVTPIKLDGRNWTQPCKTFDEAKAFAIERAKSTQINQVIKPVKQVFPTYIITKDGWQINQKTRNKFRVKGFNGTGGLGNTSAMREQREDDLPSGPGTSDPQG